MLLWAKKASTGIEVGVLCCCQCYFVNTPNTCHAARLFLVANWRPNGYGVGGVAAIFLSLKQLRERCFESNKMYRSTLKKNVNLTVSKCSYSNHQCVAALREAILASLRIQTWKTYPGCTSKGSVIYVRHGGVPQQQFVCFSKLLYICIRYSILSFNTPSKIEMPRSFGKKHVQ